MTAKFTLTITSNPLFKKSLHYQRTETSYYNAYTCHFVYQFTFTLDVTVKINADRNWTRDNLLTGSHSQVSMTSARMCKGKNSSLLAEYLHLKFNPVTPSLRLSLKRLIALDYSSRMLYIYTVLVHACLCLQRKYIYHGTFICVVYNFRATSVITRGCKDVSE